MTNGFGPLRAALRAQLRLRQRAVVAGMVRDQHVDRERAREAGHAVGGGDVGLEPRHVLAEVEGGAAPQHDRVRAAARGDIEDRRQRAQRVAGRHVEGHRGVAERQRLAVLDDAVALGRRHPVLVRKLEHAAVHLRPVGLAGDDARLVLLHEVVRAAVVVAMGVRDDDELDLRRVEAQLDHAALDEFLRLARVVQGIDEDDAVGGLQRPRRDPRRGDVVQVVEGLARRRARRGDRAVEEAVERRAARPHRGLRLAERQQRFQVVAGEARGLRDVGLDSRLRSCCVGRGGAGAVDAEHGGGRDGRQAKKHGMAHGSAASTQAGPRPTGQASS